MAEQYDKEALAAKQFVIYNDPKAAQTLGFLPPENPQRPAVLISSQPGIELARITDLDHYDDQIMVILIRISQWLALARGFPAVHLFCDIVRPFTIYGVDVANAVQVEFCNHLTGMLTFPWDPVELYPLFPNLERDIEAHEHCPKKIQKQNERNNWAEQRLMIHSSLWCRDDKAIAWDYPLQTLVWEEKQDDDAEYGWMELGDRIYPYAVTSRAIKESGLSEIHQFHNMYGVVFGSSR